jgi:hypothetical protein
MKITSYSILAKSTYGTILVIGFGLLPAPGAFAQTSCTLSPNGLVDWWPANGFAADVAGTNNGALQNGASYAPGEVGQAFDLSASNSYVALPDNFFPFPMTGTSMHPFSFEVWFKTSSGGVIFGMQDVPAFASGSHNRMPIMYVGTDGKLRAELFWYGSASPLTAPNAVTNGVFHHAAATYNGTSQILYLDGLSVATNQPVLSAISSPTLYYQFGVGWAGSGWPGGNGGWYQFNGLIDEPSLYSRALTPQEIASIYNAGAAGKLFIVGSAPPTAEPEMVGNPDFSVPPLGAACIYVGANGQGQPPTDSSQPWTFTGRSGLAQSGCSPCSSFALAGNSPVPQYAYIQLYGAEGGAISQTVHFRVAGWSELSYLEAGRAGCSGEGGDLSYTVALSNVLGNSAVFVLTNQSASSQPFTNRSALFFVPEPGNYALSFESLAPTGPNSDNTVYLAAVVVRPPPCAATATATVANGFVVEVAVTDGGCGYTNTPGVRLLGGGGIGAEAEAVVSNGVVVAVNIQNTGQGYTNAPQVVIAPPFIAQPTLDVFVLAQVSFSGLAAGTNYQLQGLSDGAWSDLGPAFTAASSGFTQYVKAAGGYRLAALPAPEQAYAAAQVDNGFLVGGTVTSGGSGYTTNLAVTIVGNPPPPSGSNATAIAVVSNGVVTGIVITDPGMGYFNGANIIIPPPPAGGLSPSSVQQVMKLDLADLSPYDSYQLEFTPGLGVPWGDLGAPFSPAFTTATQLASVSGNAGFFRVRYLGH